jgi:hypothetical protein
MLMAQAAHSQLYAAGCAALSAATAHNADNKTVAAECDAAAAVTAGLKAACAAAAGTAATAAAAAAALHAGAATVAALAIGSEAHAKAFGETGAVDALAAALAVLHSDEQFAQLVAAAAAVLLKYCADNKARLKKAGLLQAATSGSSSGAAGAGAGAAKGKSGKKGRSRMASSTGSDTGDDERGRRAMTCA